MNSTECIKGQLTEAENRVEELKKQLAKEPNNDTTKIINLLCDNSYVHREDINVRHQNTQQISLALLNEEHFSGDGALPLIYDRLGWHVTQALRTNDKKLILRFNKN